MLIEMIDEEGEKAKRRLEEGEVHAEANEALQVVAASEVPGLQTQQTTLIVTQDSQVKQSESDSSKSGEMMVMDDGSNMSDVLSAVTRPHEEENKRPV